MAGSFFKISLIALLALHMSSCGRENADTKTLSASEEPITGAANAASLNQVNIANNTENLQPKKAAKNSLQANLTDSDLRTSFAPEDIPYPLYPNGRSYRIGSEGSLKVILFQTEDSFDQVDEFYQERLVLARLSAMSDYVRYSSNEDDTDPWGSSKPGIVIHQFNNDSERKAVGADDYAITNIIMSFE